MTHMFHILKSTNIRLDIRKIVGLSMRKRLWCLFDVGKPYKLTVPKNICKCMNLYTYYSFLCKSLISS